MKTIREVVSCVILLVLVVPAGCRRVWGAEPNVRAAYHALYAGDMSEAISRLSMPSGSEKASFYGILDRYLALAFAQVATDNFAQAEHVRKHLVVDRCPIPATSEVFVANQFRDLAFLYDRKGRYAEAESIYKRSLEVLADARGEWQLAAFYSAHGKTALAIHYRLAATRHAKAQQLPVSELARGMRGDTLFAQCFCRGRAAFLDGDISSCLTLFGAALYEASKSDGLPPDANKARMLSEIGATFLQSSQAYSAAVRAYERSLSVQSQLSNPSEKEVFDAKMGLGIALDFSGEHSRATEIYLSAPGGAKSACRELMRKVTQYGPIPGEACSTPNPNLVKRSKLLLKSASDVRLQALSGSQTNP